MAKLHVSTTINGEPEEFLCEPNETMLDALRNRRCDMQRGGSLGEFQRHGQRRTL